MKRRLPSLGLALWLLLLILPGRVWADMPKYEEQFVYQLRLFDGNGYPETFIPRNEDTIYLLADINNVVSPRMTLVYFWPLTGKFVAAFKRAPAAMELHNPFIGGLLEHTLGVARAAVALLPLYPKLNADLVLTAAITEIKVDGESRPEALVPDSYAGAPTIAHWCSWYLPHLRPTSTMIFELWRNEQREMLGDWLWKAAFASLLPGQPLHKFGYQPNRD